VLVVRVLPGAQHVLVAGVVGTFIQHPAATLHLDGIAAAQIGAQVRTVSTALVASALEVFIFVENNLEERKQKQTSMMLCDKYSTNVLSCLAAHQMKDVVVML